MRRLQVTWPCWTNTLVISAEEKTSLLRVPRYQTAYSLVTSKRATIFHNSKHDRSCHQLVPHLHLHITSQRVAATAFQRWSPFPKRRRAQGHGDRDRCGASEPLCFAQGAAANIPKFPRRQPTPSHTTRPPHSKPASISPPLPHPQARAQPRTTTYPVHRSSFQHVFCTTAPRPPMPYPHTGAVIGHWILC
jgi:hypothetical protein